MLTDGDKPYIAIRDKDKKERIDRQQEPEFKVLDVSQLKDYLFARAEELQHRGDWNSSFECLYLMTVINRGYYFDQTGRHHISYERLHDTAAERKAEQHIRDTIKELEYTIWDCQKIEKATVDPEGKAFWRGRMKQAEKAIALLKGERVGEGR